MIQRFFLYRVDAKSARPTVGRQDDAFTLSGANKAQPALALAQLAKTRAKVALQPSVVLPVPVTPGHGIRADIA